MKLSVYIKQGEQSLYGFDVCGYPEDFGSLWSDAMYSAADWAKQNGKKVESHYMSGSGLYVILGEA